VKYKYLKTVEYKLFKHMKHPWRQADTQENDYFRE